MTSLSSDVPPPPSGAGWTRRRITFLSVAGAVLIGVLLFAREVLLPFILAVITAYVLTPLVAFCERARMPRVVAIVVVYLTTFSAIYLSVASLAPRIYDEALQLSRETPALARELATRWGPVVESRARALLDRMDPPAGPQTESAEPALRIVKDDEDEAYTIHVGSGIQLVKDGPNVWRIRPLEADMPEFSVGRLVSDGIDETVAYIKRNALELIRVGQTIVSKVSRGIFLTFMTLMVTGYLIHTRDDIVAFLRSLPPPRARPSFDRLVYRIDRGFAGVVRGQLFIMLVNGILSALGFWFFGLKYWPILALIAGIMSIIPIFGSILSTIPAVLVGLTQDLWTALWVLIWIILIHLAEANLLNPKIIGVAAKLHPVLVIFALIVGEHYFGLWGALLAVPTLSLAQSLFNHFRFETMPDAASDTLGDVLRTRADVIRN